MYDKPNIDKLIIGTPAQAEDCDCVVCAPYDGVTLGMPDNLTGTCSKCGCAVQFRPTSPKTPPKMCWSCMVIETAKHEDDGDEDVFMITPKTFEEIAEYLDKKRAKLK